jgi:hypothetical protein
MNSLTKGTLTAVAGIAGGTALSLAGRRMARNRQLQRIWDALDQPAGDEVFDESMVAGLPELARRYLLHSIQPGTRLAGSVKMKFTSDLYLKPDTKPFFLHGKRILAPYRGFVWRGITHGFIWRNQPSGPVWESGESFYFEGEGLERSQYFDIIPIKITMNNPSDVAKMFLGRFLSESVLIPSSLLPQFGVIWEEIDDLHVRALVSHDGEQMPLTLRIGPAGQLEEARFERWGAKGGETSFRYIPCGIEVLEEATFGGYTIPSRHTYTWWYKSAERGPSQSFTYTIEEATFR